ncbi:MAG: hypothetical protein HQ564_05840 [Candidatus Saganbacteria bacterium]|nr:hypothetical protein [Candidatus Saganbacteria bacterium]
MVAINRISSGLKGLGIVKQETLKAVSPGKMFAVGTSLVMVNNPEIMDMLRGQTHAFQGGLNEDVLASVVGTFPGEHTISVLEERGVNLLIVITEGFGPLVTEGELVDNLSGPAFDRMAELGVIRPDSGNRHIEPAKTMDQSEMDACEAERIAIENGEE